MPGGEPRARAGMGRWRMETDFQKGRSLEEFEG